MYYSLQIEISEEATELLQAVIDASGPLGLEVRDHTLKAPPGTPPLPPEVVQITAYYESQAEADDTLLEVHRELPGARGSVAPVAEEDWAETWKKHVKSTRIGRVWIGPPWERDTEAAKAAPVAIVIEPGMAFGTGDHPTTSMCVAELERALERRPEASVLDVGTGSGVLAIAARKLGAGRILGNDIDPVAVRIAAENAEHNEAADLEFTERPIERIDGLWDVVVANLFANVLVQLAPRLAARTAPNGVVLLSGILLPQASEIVEAYERENLELLGRRVDGEWVQLTFAPRA